MNLEKEKKQTEDEAAEKEKLRDRKCKLIGNYVHESVPVNDNEVRKSCHLQWKTRKLTSGPGF